MPYTQAFAYTSRVGILVKLAALTATGAAASLWFALTRGGRGLIIQRSIRLSPDEANTFYWVMFMVNLLVALVMVAALIRRKNLTRRLELFESYLLAPSSRWLLSNYEQIITYKSISIVQLINIGEERVLRIKHHGATLDVERTQMTSDEDFSRFGTALMERMAERRAFNQTTVK